MVIGVSAGKPAINMSRSRYSYSLIAYYLSRLIPLPQTKYSMK